MNSLKILVGGSFPFIGGPENGKKNFEKILKFFQVPQLSAPECWNAETPYLGPNEFAGSKFGQGRPLGMYIFEKMAKISWTVKKFTPETPKKPLISRQV